MSALDDVLRLIATHLALHDSWPREVRLDAPRLRALAHELDGEDFRRLCEHLQLRARHTPGASAGGRSVVQLHDTQHVPAATLERTRLWLGVRAADAPISSFADAFVPRPEQWGLRGDPHLWDALRRRLPAASSPSTTSRPPRSCTSPSAS